MAHAADIPATVLAEREKRAAALSSVLAAVFLTVMKLAVGLLTGSLGILAEAAHSALDLVAAVVTLLAVRVAGRPPDEEYTYGRGKVENLSALIETLLLFLTCAWIIYEAVRRLFFHPVEVEATVWSFLVMAVSIVVDVTRSRMLYATARKHQSQALEADALHFSTDVWSSAVVIFGLVLVWLGPHVLPEHRELLTKFDAVAALGVAFIVLFISYQLGRRTIDVLLDRAPAGLPGRMAREVAHIDGVLAVERVRVRRSGPSVFVDLNAALDRNLSFERTHAIAEAIEAKLREMAPGADVVVHTDPREPEKESVAARIRAVASAQGAAVHNIAVHDSGGQLHVDMHVEVDERLSLGQAHRIASALEDETRRQVPNVADVTTHIESRGADVDRGSDVTLQEAAIVAKIAELAAEVVGPGACHDIVVRRLGTGYSVSMHCVFDAAMPIRQVHDVSSALESRMRQAVPELDRVLIHTEPAEE
jgi:cation diffusion facilitator family transporter